MRTFEQIEKQPALGQTCRELRERSGLTVEVFADRYNLTRQTVYNFEHGATDSLKTLRAYLDLSRGCEK